MSDVWEGIEMPKTHDGAEHHKVFEEIKKLNKGQTKDEILWSYFQARQGDLKYGVDTFLYSTELEKALERLLKALPKHESPDDPEVCPICNATQILNQGFKGSLDRREEKRKAREE